MSASRFLLALVAALAAGLPAPASAATYWQANYDSCDLSEWLADGFGGEFNTGAGDSFTVASPTWNGSACALDMHLDDSAGQSVTRLLRKAGTGGAALPTSAIYGSRYYFKTVPTISTHLGVAQVKSNYFATAADCSSRTISSDPLWTINLENAPGGLVLRLDQHISDTGVYAGFVRSYSTTTLLPVKRWFRVELNYTWSATGAGSVTLLLDSVPLVTLSGVYTEILGVACAAHQADIHRYWGIDAYSGGSLSPAVWDLYADGTKVYA